MLYILYIIIGVFIVLGVNLAVTAFWAIHDAYKYKDEDKLDFQDSFKKYFAKNNNLPTKMSDLFNF